MGVVVALLHLTVACQYVLCGLYWGYTKATRPELLEDAFFVLGVLAPVAAAAYTACSPLGGKSHHPDLLFSMTSDASEPVMEERANAVVVVVEPEWAGGMFDCCGSGEAASTCCLSVSCTFCVFGWNAERLGFGNRYVHAATFALLWVLGVSALHILNLLIGEATGGSRCGEDSACPGARSAAGPSRSRTTRGGSSAGPARWPRRSAPPVSTTSPARHSTPRLMMTRGNRCSSVLAITTFPVHVTLTPWWFKCRQMIIWCLFMTTRWFHRRRRYRLWWCKLRMMTIKLTTAVLFCMAR